MTGCPLQLQASETMNYDDAFTLEMVSQPLLDKFSYVAGIVPVLTSYLNQVCLSPRSSPRSCDLVLLLSRVALLGWSHLKTPIWWPVL